MIILALGLKLNPTNIPSVLVNKPTPYFSIPSLETEDKKLTNEMFIGEVNILNIFSSWCIPCLIEHPQMEKLSEYYKIPVYGINYKDKKEDCRKWLKKNGNPYQLIGLDPTGRTSIDLGSYGVPENFLTRGKIISSISFFVTGPVCLYLIIPALSIKKVSGTPYDPRSILVLPVGSKPIN